MIESFRVPQLKKREMKGMHNEKNKRKRLAHALIVGELRVFPEQARATVESVIAEMAEKGKIPRYKPVFK